MKLALQLTVLALVGAAASAQELRGPAVLADVAVSDAEDANKRSAAQKRADQRSERRRREGRTRSASEERAERRRKETQARRSGRGNPFDDSDRRNSRRWQDRRNAADRRRYGNQRSDPWRTHDGRRCRCTSRSTRKNCRCDGFEYDEDADLVADFLEDYGEDAEFIADFLFDAFDNEESAASED